MEQTINYKGYTIEIKQDSDPQNPRTDWDPAAHMVCWHSRYHLGDMDNNGQRGRERKEWPVSENYSEPIDLLYSLANIDRDEAQEANFVRQILGSYNNWKENRNIEDDETTQESEIISFITKYINDEDDAREEKIKEDWRYNIWTFMNTEDYDAGCVHSDLKFADLYKAIEERGTVIRTLGLLDHSGLHIYIGGRAHWSDPGGWDSGPVGYIYMTKEDIISTYGNDSPESYENANKLMEGEIETYDDYLRGNVYGYDVEDIGDSCWGFYGEEGVKDAISQAKDCIDSYIKTKIKDHLQQVKAWIKNKVPVIYRKPLQLI